MPSAAGFVGLQAVDGIFHVCRAFEDPDVIHVEDRIDPVEDLEIIHAELRAKDLARVKTEYEVRGFAVAAHADYGCRNWAVVAGRDL